MRLVDIEKIQNKCLNLTICDGYEKNYINAMYKIMKNAPTVNAKEEIHAKWVYVSWCNFKCSNCGEKSNSKPYRGKEKYCPNCGAKMDEATR